jgi:membrane dipeptidase
MNKFARLARAQRAVSATLLLLAWTALGRAQGAPAPAHDLTRHLRAAAEAERVAARVLERAIIIDTHADTPQMMLDENYDLGDPHSPYMLSISKMGAGNLGAEFFSIWVDVAWPKDDVIHRALDLIDVVDQQVTRHADTLEPARTADDVVRIHRQGKIAALMGVEGGHIIENDPRMLDVYYALGVRYMTLTHTRNTAWADSSGDKAQVNGLNDFGRQVVERMNRLGMMVDVSHVSDATFYAALAASKAPVIASHSSCRALCNAPRNLTDDMMRALAKNGGVVDINFYSPFLDQKFRDAYATVEKAMDADVKTAKDRLAKQGKRLSYAEETRIRQQSQKGLPAPSYTVIADHIDHAVAVGGVDHVGLGSDFDGVDAIPAGCEDASKLPGLVQELARRGYSEDEMVKILGGNVLRVMRAVERVSRRLNSTENGSTQ